MILHEKNLKRHNIFRVCRSLKTQLENMSRAEAQHLQVFLQFFMEVSELNERCEEFSKNLLHPEFGLPNLCAPLPQ